MPKIVSWEGNENGELGGVPGELTIDSAHFCLNFEIETPGVYIGAGGVGLLQRVYIEADTQGQDITVTVILDGTETSFGVINTSGKQVREKAIDLTGYIASIRLTSVNVLTTRIEVSAVELDLYVPEIME